MGFMNVLKFSAACFDLLVGWPLFALGYPLCASIWVIETKSISDIRKLVTYWVLFSLITLFEDAFSNLLECSTRLVHGSTSCHESALQ
ncbi:HVA22-like protein a [Vitis riparia]|uniref:HVA22-like protein a n=1 Tax=Vitis riparia TaxID=96939 RepID=UPI00155A1B96|nr:HVA22-like protein a [Vitis riparia]